MSATICDLDALPIWLLKKRLDHQLPLITAIINRSVAGSVEQPTINPAFKRSGLDKKAMENYRSISNLLSFRFIESVVSRHIEEHLEHTDLHDNYQYAYRTDHSITKCYLESAG